MKIRIPVIIEDQLTQMQKSISEPTEFITLEDDVFLDGPVSSRIAVLDFDEEGRLREPAKFIPPESPGKPGKYAGTDNIGVPSESREFMQVNVFGVAYRTLEMFEEADTLGRKIRWAFNSPQLLLIPRAGEWENAFYQRDSHSIQFFYFPSRRYEHWKIYTSLSHDIVAHETGHAILDGIAPDLYNSITPQSLALHESIADLTALIASFRSKPLMETVLRQTNGSIENSTAFSRIAMEFGANQEAGKYMRPLRNLLNNKKLPKDGPGRTEPHELSEILSGALYAVMVKMHEMRRMERMEQGDSVVAASIWALFVAGNQFKRMIFRALDYLPPGEITFADYGRAIVAADKASHPKDVVERGWIAKEFKSRNIIRTEQELLNTEIEEKRKSALTEALSRIDLTVLIESDWVAYDFANRYRDLLGIPETVTFEVRPRIDICKRYYHRDGEANVRECIFKVSWSQPENNPAKGRLPLKRMIIQGITMAIDRETKQIRSFLSTGITDDQVKDRDLMLAGMLDEGLLQMRDEAITPEGFPYQGRIPYTVSGGVMKVKNTAHMLHIAHSH